jgi:ABC-type Fe3+ transport system permease subunit
LGTASVLSDADVAGWLKETGAERTLAPAGIAAAVAVVILCAGAIVARRQRARKRPLQEADAPVPVAAPTCRPGH